MPSIRNQKKLSVSFLYLLVYSKTSFVALTYCKNYNKIFDAFLKEKRESHLSVTNFSVQIFTLIPVAEFCLENSDILAELIGKMIEILEPGFNPSAGLDFAKLRGFNFQKFSVLTHDALHITRNIKSKILKILNLNKTINSFMFSTLVRVFVPKVESRKFRISLYLKYSVTRNKSFLYIF